jgi:hypothetical protein
MADKEKKEKKKVVSIIKDQSFVDNEVDVDGILKESVETSVNNSKIQTEDMPNNVDVNKNKEELSVDSFDSEAFYSEYGIKLDLEKIEQWMSDRIDKKLTKEEFHKYLKYFKEELNRDLEYYKKMKNQMSEIKIEEEVKWIAERIVTQQTENYLENKYKTIIGSNKIRYESELLDDYIKSKSKVEFVLEDIHKLKPDYIFLTDTSAIHCGYILKEAWKELFPEEKCPKFYRIDPRAFAIEHGYSSFDEYKKSGLNRENMEKSLSSYLEKIIDKKSANIIVYDEYHLYHVDKITDSKVDAFRSSGFQTSAEVAAVGIKDALKKIKKDSNNVYRLIGGELLYGKFSFDRELHPTGKWYHRFSMGTSTTEEKIRSNLNNYLKILESEIDDPQGLLVKGFTKKGSKERKEILKAINELKEFGRDAVKDVNK